MNILQMSILDLKMLVEEEMEVNPLLELEEPSSKNPIQNLSDDITDMSHLISRPPTLQEYLLRQLMTLDLHHEEIEICEELIGNIDDNGYLKIDVQEIANSIGKDITKIQNALNILHAFDPIGVGARNLKECLLIQLRNKNKMGTLIWRIVDGFLEECGKRQYNKIAKAIDASPEEIKKCVLEITKLDPKPGKKFSIPENSQYITPDIYVKKFEDDYQILHNYSEIPRIKVNTLYNSILKDKNHDSNTQDYIKNKMRSANFIVNCLKQRRETIREITEFLIKEQNEFIEKGRHFLKPLTFKTVAEAIGKHESTISRAIANKYIELPSGVYEFKEFFSSKISNGNGNGNSNNTQNDEHSTTSLKIELKHIIDLENKKKPLSDKKLQDIFIEKDINISRRTIAKYREELKILPSYLRKI